MQGDACQTRGISALNPKTILQMRGEYRHEKRFHTASGPAADGPVLRPSSGVGTHHYGLCPGAAKLVGPVLVGGMFDLTKAMSSSGEINYWSLFFYAPVCFALALVCMSQVKHGETQTISEEMIAEIRDENED